VIKASLLLVAAFAVAPLFRHRSPAERHVLWASALLLAALVPVFAGIAPRWQPGFVRRAAAVMPDIPLLSFGPAGRDGSVSDIVVHADSIETPDGILRAATVGWLGGIAMILIVSIRAGWRLRSFRHRAERIVDPLWHHTLADVACRLGVRRSIQLLHARDDDVGDMPVMWGLFRPCIVVPASARAWSADRVRIVLAHEVGHIHRHDWIVRLAAKAVCALYWFNPLFWAAAGRLHQESEQACDDVALGLGVDRCDYATHLLEIARERTSARTIPALGMAQPSTIERRFAALLKPTDRRAPRRLQLVAIAAGMFLLTWPLSAIDVSGLRATVRLRTSDLPAILETADTRRDTSVIHAIRNARSGDTGTDVVPPEVIEYSAPPLYSDEARNRKVEGVVTLEVVIDAAGRTGLTRVVRGLGFGLDDNARLAVRHWQFAPARQHGIPIESIATIDVTFSLANEALNELIANDMATRVGPGVTPPRIVRRVPVSTGSADRSDRPSGSVVLDVVLREDGTPRVVRIVRSLESDRDREAIQAFEQWRFSPAMKDGAPVKVRLNAEVTFP